MRTIWRWAPVLAAVAGVILVTSGSAGSAGAAVGTGGGSGSVAITQPAQQTVTDHKLSSVATSVSCLTASLCVAVGSQNPGLPGSRGVVVTLTNGAQSHAGVLRRSSVIDSVSCPSKSGCWAVGDLAHGTGTYLVKISSAGRAVAEKTVPVPAGTTLGPISCTSMESCKIAGGTRVRPAAIEIGDWNGKKLHLHPVTVKGSKQVSMTAISCWHTGCEAVGTAAVPPRTNDGLILTIAHGKPAGLNADSGDPGLGSVSCVSATTCYAVDGSNSVVTITRGVVTDRQGGAGAGLNAIECTGTECEAAGTVLKPQYSSQDGWLQSLSDGTWGASIDDGDTCWFTGIAPRGRSGGFIAVGTGPNCYQDSDIAVG
jgi:hypothetical protein